MKTKKKRPKYVTLTVDLPPDVARFYHKAAKLVNLTPSKVLLTILIVKSLKIQEQSPAENKP